MILYVCVWLYSFLSACLFNRQFEQDVSFFELLSSFISFFHKRLKDVHYVLERPVFPDIPGFPDVTSACYSIRPQAIGSVRSECRGDCVA